MDGAARLLRGVEYLAGGAGEVVLGERLADIDAARGEEGIGHAAADDQVIDPGDEVPEHVQLGRDLGAADHGRDRAFGVAERGLQRLQLRLHRAAGISGQQMGDPSVEAWARWAAEKASLT